MCVISEEELREVVEVVWMTALDLQLTEDNNSEFDPSDYLIAQIKITGAWQGVVTVKVSNALLSCAGSIIFGSSIGDVTVQDRTDALAELTNMLGGTVKCLLPEGSDLSLPELMDEDDVVTHNFDWVRFCFDSMLLAVAITDNTGNSRKAA